MTFACLWSSSFTPESMTGLIPALLKVVPRLSVDVERQLIWADARSLPTGEISRQIATVSAQHQVNNAQLGLSRIPIAAEVAARITQLPLATMLIPPGKEREFLDPQPVTVLAPSPQIQSLFDGVGIEKCADLARLDSESVEVRFGAEGVEL